MLLELWSNQTLLKGLPGSQRSGGGGKCSRAEQRGEASAGGCAAPPGISCRLTTAPTAVRVVGTVNGSSFQLVVDAVSEKTFMGADLVDVSSVLEATQQLCSVTRRRKRKRLHAACPSSSENTVGDGHSTPPKRFDRSVSSIAAYRRPWISPVSGLRVSRR
ncbi:hypothetical protein E2C01_052563 [Portunus trituberculatus]|uniref:Uncharacterized protein n=1 Tax=Portunus trituberculatus TaxID=210409 RepID=A0A5B7GNK4_PORTR|nr:hypothetical protein [Portunus trituberculatus]